MPPQIHALLLLSLFFATEVAHEPVRAAEILAYVMVGFLAGIGLYAWTQKRG